MNQSNPFELIITKLDNLELIINNWPKQSNYKIQDKNLEEELIEIKEVELLLKMPVSTIHYHKKLNELPYLKVGKRCLFYKQKVLEWASKQGKINNISKLDKILKSK